MYCEWVSHCKTFTARPRNDDVYAFMDEFNWGRLPMSEWKLVRGRVCRRAWRVAVGQEPTRFFTDGREHPVELSL